MPRKTWAPHLISSLTGGKNARVIAARTTMDYQGVWRRREQGGCGSGL